MNKIDASIASMLKVMQIVLRSFSVEYFLVGAFARDIQLSKKPGFVAKRKTKDVDLAVFLNDETQFILIKQALIDTGEFEDISNNTLKLIYQKRLEVDLLPFGDIEDEDRHVQLQGGALLTLDVSGLREIFPFVESQEVSPGVLLDICPLEGLVLLKLIANEEDSSRTKDITDIEHLIDVYFDLNIDEIYTEHYAVFDEYENDPSFEKLVASRLIGRKMRDLLRHSPLTLSRVINILAKRQTENWQAMAKGLQDN